MIELTIPGPPLPWKAAFVGSRGAYSPRYSISIEIKKIIRTLYQGPILDEALIVDLIFHMPIPKSTSKKKRLLMISGIERPEGTPDRINMGKYYEDLLQDIVIKNDSKIVGGRVDKYYSEEPRTEIKIWKLK